MNQITSITVDGRSYTLSDPNAIPQPETAQEGSILQVSAVQDGKISALQTIAPENLGAKILIVPGRFYEMLEAEADYYGPAIRLYLSEADAYQALEGGRPVFGMISDYAKSASIWLLPLELVDGMLLLGGLRVNYSDKTETVFMGECKPYAVQLGDVAWALRYIISLQEELIG